jgi:hypothetical protein
MNKEKQGRNKNFNRGLRSRQNANAYVQYNENSEEVFHIMYIETIFFQIKFIILPFINKLIVADLA